MVRRWVTSTDETQKVDQRYYHFSFMPYSPNWTDCFRFPLPKNCKTTEKNNLPCIDSLLIIREEAHSELQRLTCSSQLEAGGP